MMGKTNNPDKPEASDILAELGISQMLADKWRAIAAIPVEVMDRYRELCEAADEEFTEARMFAYAKWATGHAGTDYRSSPTKRTRRTKSQVEDLEGTIYSVLLESHPQTVRQLYYRLVSSGVIEKTEAAYKMVCHRTAEMRRDCTLPYSWLADNTRWMRKPKTWTGLAGMLEHQQQFYRRDLWAEQDAYVEVWLEKDALAGVLLDVTATWDVPLMVTRGYPSLSYLHSAGEQIAAENRPVFLYYFGDHDPSGVDITRAVERGIREFAPDVELYFERVAVTPGQIEEFNLPTRPTKGSDSRSRNFEGESVEVDALPVEVLKSICRDCITQHIDDDRHERLRVVEEAERNTLAQIAAALPGGAA